VGDLGRRFVSLPITSEHLEGFTLVTRNRKIAQYAVAVLAA
jgi:hypothetical protein